jgi:hypothetical protein
MPSRPGPIQDASSPMAEAFALRMIQHMQAWFQLHLSWGLYPKKSRIHFMRAPVAIALQTSYFILASFEI